MRFLAALFTVLWLLPVSGARADVSKDLVEDLVDGSVIPAYRAFEAKTDTLSRAVDGACAEEALATDAVKAAFAEAWLAWAGARHVVKGPVTYFDRQFRIEFWPDGRNRIDRALAELRAAGGTPEIASAVVGVQGFPALERLIYTGEGAADCFLARPIAANLHNIAAEILTEWTEGDSPFRAALVAPGSGAGVYFSYSESLTALMTGAVTSLEGVLRLRLKRPLGEESGKVWPKRVEAWRSGLSLDLIRADLAAVAGFYHGGADEGEAPRGLDGALRQSGEADLADLMTKAFRLTRETADGIDMPLSEAVSDPAAKARLEELATQVSALKALIDQKVAPALGIPGGFNAMDGD
jgi:predicted lipoprotein